MSKAKVTFTHIVRITYSEVVDTNKVGKYDVNKALGEIEGRLTAGLKSFDKHETVNVKMEVYL